MEKKNITDLLERLLEVIKISRKGYKDAAEQVKDPVLQTRFNQYTQQRNIYMEKLSSMVTQNGGTPGDAESFEGNMMRMWIDFKSGLIGHDNAKIIDQCLKEEQNTLIEFDNALKEELPDSIKNILDSMDEEIKKSYQQLQEFRQQYN